MTADIGALVQTLLEARDKEFLNGLSEAHVLLRDAPEAGLRVFLDLKQSLAERLKQNENSLEYNKRIEYVLSFLSEYHVRNGLHDDALRFGSDALSYFDKTLQLTTKGAALSEEEKSFRLAALIGRVSILYLMAEACYFDNKKPAELGKYLSQAAKAVTSLISYTSVDYMSVIISTLIDMGEYYTTKRALPIAENVYRSVWQSMPEREDLEYKLVKELVRVSQLQIKDRMQLEKAFRKANKT